MCISFEKARFFYGPAAEEFTARLEPSGWVDEGATDHHRENRDYEMREAVIAYVREHPACSKNQVTGNVKGRATVVRAILERLDETGTLKKQDGLYRVA